MDSFGFAEVVFAVGFWVLVAETLAHLVFLPAAFHLGPAGVSWATTTSLPPGLALPRRDVTLSLKYRVLPGHACVFRAQWSREFRSPFHMVGAARWMDGTLQVVARYALGPPIMLLGLLIVMLDAALGFIRQGEAFTAFFVLLLTSALVLGVPLMAYATERRRFLGFIEELHQDLAHSPLGGEVAK